MPKLNVQQTNQNVIQAFKNALAIGNLKGIIASDGSHNFSTAGSNQNLLDNSWFTVNQRGQSSYNSAGYSVDRWLSNGAQRVTVSSDGVTLGEQGYRFVQRMENPAIFAGKTLTISAKTNAANVRFAYWDSASDYNNGTAITVPVEDGYASLTINITNGIYAIGLSTASGTGGLYRAMKLEHGSFSTLPNDAPPDYETELDHCRKYFYRIKAETSFGTFGNGFCSGGNAAYVLVPINMRKTPTSGSTSGAFRLMVGAGVTTGVTVTYSGNSNSHMARFDVSQSGSSWTAGGSCILSAHSDTNAYIDLNADL